MALNEDKVLLNLRELLHLTELLLHFYSTVGSMLLSHERFKCFSCLLLFHLVVYAKALMSRVHKMVKHTSKILQQLLQDF